jgi:hypothetical protein
VFIVAKKAMHKHTELLLDYNLDSYWVAMEKIIKDHQIISSMQKTVFNLQLQAPIGNWNEELPTHVDLDLMRKNVTALGAKLWELKNVPDNAKFKSAAAKLASAVELFNHVLEEFESNVVSPKIVLRLHGMTSV